MVESVNHWATASLIGCLKEAQQNGTLEKIATKWHKINLDEVIEKLQNLEAEIERKEILKVCYPSLYIHILKL